MLELQLLQKFNCMICRYTYQCVTDLEYSFKIVTTNITNKLPKTPTAVIIIEITAIGITASSLNISSADNKKNIFNHK